MKKPGPLPPRSAPLRPTPIKRKKRTPSEFARIYGSKERVEFVKSLYCFACGQMGYTENAHVCGNGGKSRKADYLTIAPLCGPRVGAAGCHHFFDEHRSEFDAFFRDFDPDEAAAMTERFWQSHLRQTGRARQGENE